MPLSLRMPSAKEERIRRAAAKSGKSKTAFILEAVDEKLGLQKSREQVIRELSGWLSHEEAEELRKTVEVFNSIHQGDWD
jgi:predicted DNA-binding protein